jgi:hypothetical protein
MSGAVMKRSMPWAAVVVAAASLSWCNLQASQHHHSHIIVEVVPRRSRADTRGSVPHTCNVQKVWQRRFIIMQSGEQIPIISADDASCMAYCC